MDVHLIQPVSTWRLHRSTVENSSPMSNNENHSIDRQKKEAIELQVSTAALIFADSLILYKSALNTSLSISRSSLLQSF